MGLRTGIASLAIVALLTACGGGGGGGSTAAGASQPLGGIGGADTAGSAGGTSTSTPSTGSGASSGNGAAAGAGPSTGGTPAAGESTPVARSAAFQVNTDAAGTQNTPSVAALADGGYVVAWHRDDAQATGIYVRRFAADGSAMGPESRIDEPAAGRFVSVAKVAGLEGGGYAIAWQSRSADFDRWSLHLRHVRADGTLSAVREDAVLWFQTYQLVSLAGGGYARLVQGPTDGDPANATLRLERFSADDRLLDTQLADTPVVVQQSASGVVLADGRRLLSWVRSDEARGGGVGRFFRFMAADGTLEATTHVGAVTSSQFATVVTAALGDGGFVIAGPVSTGSNSTTISVQRYAADGAPLGEPIPADDEADVASLGTSCTTSDKGGVHPCPFPWQLNPAIAGTPDGGFVLAWETPDRQRPGRFIYARKFDAQGHASGAPFAADTATPGQSQPVLAASGSGLLLTWIGRDADQSGIFARAYRD